jgi:predicted metal-binding membrane protein
VSPAIPVLIGSSWLVLVISRLWGIDELLHHHNLVEGELPLALTLPLLLIGWQVMLAAMMLPASLPALRAIGPSSGAPSSGAGPQPTRALALFLVAYAAVWAGFALAAFFGDWVLHHLVEASPWLADRPWLVGAGVFALAGAYQFTPFKRRGLDACRHPAGAEHGSLGTLVAARFGLRHALDCLASSWALMLLMFAAGVANLWWMAALAVVMAYEAMGRHGRLGARMVGIVLIGLAGLTVLSGSAIGFGPG